MAADTGFYVYIWRRAGGVPCYVGKGCGNRWRRHVKDSHNDWLNRIFAKEGADMFGEIVASGLPESEAFELERFLIAEIGRRQGGNGPLVNLTDGGEGTSGREFSHDEATKAQLGAISKKRWSDLETRARILAAQAAGKATPEFKIKRRAASKTIWSDPDRRAESSARQTLRMADPQVRARTSATTREAMSAPGMKEKLSAAQKKRAADPNYVPTLGFLGGKHTEEAKRKIGNGSRGKKISPETRVKMSAWQIGRKMSDEAKRKMSEAAKRRMATPEGKAHSSKAGKIGAAKRWSSESVQTRDTDQ